MLFRAKRSRYIFIIALTVLPLLINCSKILNSDSGRAQELIETLITEPENQQRLNDITLNQLWSSKNIIPYIHGHNTLRYLRARIKQDQVLEFKVSRKTTLSDNRSYVEVAVVESFPGVLREKKFTYVFRVFFKEDNDGNNIITRCENIN